MMDPIHRKALQKTRTKLVCDLDPDSELLDMLMSESVFTALMLEEIKAEKTRAQRVRHLLDSIVRRGPRAYPIFLKCLRDSSHESLANTMEDMEYQLRGLPVPNRSVGKEGQDQSEVISNYTTIYTCQHGQITNRAQGEGQPQQPSFAETFGPLVHPIQPSEESNPCASLFTPSSASISQGPANQMPGIQDMNEGQAAAGQRNDNLMELADGEAEQAQPPTEPAPTLTAYQSVPEERRYKMESTPRGLCFIINNKNYINMRNRAGTDINRDQLQDLFLHLGFWVDIQNNLPGMEMKRQLVNLSKYEGLRPVDSLVICVLCHGDNDNVYGTDGVAVNLIEDVFKIFGPQSCPALIGKPKLFVLNSCRGEARDVGNHFDTFGNNIAECSQETDVTHHLPRNVPDVRPTMQLTLPETNPSYKDLYIAYSTFQGFVSYRDNDTGSWFIEKLVEVFKEEASIHEIDIMMREVNRRVASEYDTSSLEVQMPAPSNTLTRQWYFNPA
ncbi:caspase-9-like [Ylistrum balloti]|uniref:caspase-9-like n=1 Tax=Ylistrum balloti TaxID=509963 RepID=UPI002905A9C9|nr:caspase-9-like [Ylistrum balloti]